MKNSKTSGFKGKENFQRMNFLYQAAHTVISSGGIKGDVCAYYGRIMGSISKKSVQKIEPDIKRSICKGCCVILLPGITARIRIRGSNVIWTCLRCATLKRFPTNRGYKLWVENEEACMDLMVVPTVTDDIVAITCSKSSTDSVQKEEIVESSCKRERNSESGSWQQPASTEN